tara:strand:+ start:1451 stop:2206 length:756 start_codon:yes stop_codon:yes gene_type:complete
MAEVMSMLSDENGGELTAEEQDSLQVGEQMQEAQDKRLAGKYENAEQLEAAYLELQKKLGSANRNDEAPEQEPEEPEETVDESNKSSLFDRLWDESKGDYSEDTLKELAESKPEDLAKMYLDYRSANSSKQMTEESAQALMKSVGGDKAYADMMQWAGQNMSESEIDMYDSVMDSGNINAAYFAMQALSFKYKDSVGVEGELLQGRAASETTKGFKSQAEVVTAMQDPRYDRDPAYRQEVMAKLERSNVNF